MSRNFICAYRAAFLSCVFVSKLVLATPETWVEVERFDSGVPARAQAGGRVSGDIDYLIFHQAKAKLPIENCVLQHGYGITQAMLGAAREANRTLGFNYLSDFTRLYFGLPIVNRLLATACNSVMVPLEETNNTSILELTLRTEKFLNERVCRVSSCAFVGHSKSGAVAFNLARRCMEKTSLLGEQGCHNLKKIYSATGVIQGAGATALVYGAKLKEEEGRARGWRGLADLAFLRAIDLMPVAISSSLLNGGSFAWDLKSDYEPDEHNPTWADLSPYAPMEDGLPLYLVNDVGLQKKGWLVADFSASATRYAFNGHAFDSLGCGTRPAVPSHLGEKIFWAKQNLFCESFGRSLGTLHASMMKKIFEQGAVSLGEWARKTTAREAVVRLDEVSRAVSWQAFQLGDGFADYSLAINSCLKGKELPESAVKECHTFTSLNHQATAGGAVEAADQIVKALSEN